MARLENYDKIRRTIIVERYEQDYSDEADLRKLQFIEMEKMAIIKKLQRRREIYVPGRHPLLNNHLLQQGRLIEVSDVTHCGHYISEQRNIQFIEHFDECNSIKNILEDSTLEKLQYDDEKYYKLTTLVYHNREILRLPGVQQQNLI